MDPIQQAQPSTFFKEITKICLACQYQETTEYRETPIDYKCPDCGKPCSMTYIAGTKTAEGGRSVCLAGKISGNV